MAALSALSTEPKLNSPPDESEEVLSVLLCACDVVEGKYWLFGSDCPNPEDDLDSTSELWLWREKFRTFIVLSLKILGETKQQPN